MRKEESEEEGERIRKRERKRLNESGRKWKRVYESKNCVEWGTEMNRLNE